MARGAATQESMLNTQAGTQFNLARGLYSNIQQTATDLKNPNSAVVNSFKNSATVPIAGRVAASQTALQNRSVAGRNSAGYVSGLDALARTGGGQESQAALGAQTGAYKEGAQLEAGLYAPTLTSGTGLYNAANEALKAREVKGGFGIGPFKADWG